jgi:hypothetical protein
MLRPLTTDVWQAWAGCICGPEMEGKGEIHTELISELADLVAEIRRHLNQPLGHQERGGVQ